MFQQSSSNQPMTPGSELRFPVSMPDETEYIMPQEEVLSAGRRRNEQEEQRMSLSGVPAGDLEAETEEMSSTSQRRQPGREMAPIRGMNGGQLPGGASSAFIQSQRMRNPLDMEATHMPADTREGYMASMRSLLSRNVGYFVACTFQIGNQQPVTWQGLLHTVGSDYLVLYQPDCERYISCDLNSLKFTQFHNARGVPYSAAVRNWEGR